MKIDIDQYRVRKGDQVDLTKWQTDVAAVYASKDDYKTMLEAHINALSERQQVLYAANQQSILVIFQAMDAAGKDGAIRHVMSGVNPQGCQVTSFKHPSGAELAHDFLWRCARELPERGRIGIFNRSYYEEVLIVRVHPELLAAEGIVGMGDLKSHWKNRFRSIRHFEDHLLCSGTRIIKIFLHVSKEEQRRRLLNRIDDPNKNWKFSQSDLEERRYWDDYMTAYEAVFRETSTKDAPWYIVPADDKANARLFVSQILLQTLSGMKLTYPRVSPEQRADLLKIRTELDR
jgi:PPK2 family polyphosphate:nucleotide phosphotransferase